MQRFFNVAVGSLLIIVVIHNVIQTAFHAEQYQWNAEQERFNQKQIEFATLQTEWNMEVGIKVRELESMHPHPDAPIPEDIGEIQVWQSNLEQQK